MTPEETLRFYLERARDALVWKLEGLSDYDARRPLTPTGTNLLGLVKHSASVTAGYLGEIFGRPFDREMPWLADDAEPNADMWATDDESRQDVLDLWEAAWAHAEATLDALALDATGTVPWWPPERRTVTLHQVVVHLIAELNRHAGHADIVRETIDGRAGLLPSVDNLPSLDAAAWADHVARVEAAAARAAEG